MKTMWYCRKLQQTSRKRRLNWDCFIICRFQEWAGDEAAALDTAATVHTHYTCVQPTHIQYTFLSVLISGGFSLIVKWCSCDLWPWGFLSCDHSRWEKLALKFFCQAAICQKVHSAFCKKTHRTCHCGLVGCTQGFHPGDRGLYLKVGTTFLFSVTVWLGLAKKNYMVTLREQNYMVSFRKQINTWRCFCQLFWTFLMFLTVLFDEVWRDWKLQNNKLWR